MYEYRAATTDNGSINRRNVGYSRDFYKRYYTYESYLKCIYSSVTKVGPGIWYIGGGIYCSTSKKHLGEFMRAYLIMNT